MAIEVLKLAASTRNKSFDNDVPEFASSVTENQYEQAKQGRAAVEWLMKLFCSRFSCFVRGKNNCFKFSILQNVFFCLKQKQDSNLINFL